MNTIKQHLPPTTRAQQIASELHQLWRQESIYGVEPLNSERVINRFAAAIQAAVDAEVQRIAASIGTDKLQSKIDSLKRANEILADKLATAEYQLAEQRRSSQRDMERERGRERRKVSEMEARVFEYPAILQPNDILETTP